MAPINFRRGRSKHNLVAPLGMCATILLSGCTLGPDFKRPQPPSVANYTSTPLATRFSTQGEIQTLAPGVEIKDQWWRMFQSPVLDQLVEEALAHSPTLEAAQATLKQSQHSLEAGEGVFFPQVDANLAFARQLSSPYKLGVAGTGSIFNLFTLGAAVGYTLDIFGTQRRTVEALGAQVDYQRYAALASYLSLCANVVNTTIAETAYAEQLEASRRLVEIQQQQLALTEIQASAGLIADSSVQAQRQQLAASRASLEPLAQRLAQSSHLLATLLGRAPGESPPPSLVFDSLRSPEKLPLSLPSEMVRQRPDILQAEAQLHVASAEVGVATAQLFPSLTLSAAGGWNNSSFANLSQEASRFWSVAPTLNAPLFHGGTQWQQKLAAEEALHAAQAVYRQTVLNSLAQVADVLTALEHDSAALQAQHDAWQATRSNWSHAQASGEAGLLNHQQVLASEATYQQARLNLVQARAQRMQDSVALLVALGGGWWNGGPPWANADRPAAAVQQRIDEVVK